MVAELRSRREEYGKADSRRARALCARAGSRRVGVDVLFFRNRFWERLMVNVGIVLVFWAFYLRVPKASMSAAAMRGHRAGGKEEKTPGHVVLLNAAWRPKTRVV